MPYSEKTHKLGFDTDLPLLNIYLNQDSSDAIPYLVLCKQKNNENRNRGYRFGNRVNLMLSNDTGSIEASKPFKPFGDFPRLAGPGFTSVARKFFKSIFQA